MAERNVVRPVEWLAGILKMRLSGFINGVRVVKPSRWMTNAKCGAGRLYGTSENDEQTAER
jgi:hypothetical protein